MAVDSTSATEITTLGNKVDSNFGFLPIALNAALTNIASPIAVVTIAKMHIAFAMYSADCGSILIR